jgi:hypothetical protein
VGSSRAGREMRIFTCKPCPDLSMLTFRPAQRGATAFHVRATTHEATGRRRREDLWVGSRRAFAHPDRPVCAERGPADDPTIVGTTAAEAAPGVRYEPEDAFGARGVAQHRRTMAMPSVRDLARRPKLRPRLRLLTETIAPWSERGPERNYEPGHDS